MTDQLKRYVKSKVKPEKFTDIFTNIMGAIGPRRIPYEPFLTRKETRDKVTGMDIISIPKGVLVYKGTTAGCMLAPGNPKRKLVWFGDLSTAVLYSLSRDKDSPQGASVCAYRTQRDARLLHLTDKTLHKMSRLQSKPEFSLRHFSDAFPMESAEVRCDSFMNCAPRAMFKRARHSQMDWDRDFAQDLCAKYCVKLGLDGYYAEGDYFKMSGGDFHPEIMLCDPYSGEHPLVTLVVASPLPRTRTSYQDVVDSIRKELYSSEEIPPRERKKHPHLEDVEPDNMPVRDDTEKRALAMRVYEQQEAHRQAYENYLAQHQAEVEAHRQAQHQEAHRQAQHQEAHRQAHHQAKHQAKHQEAHRQAHHQAKHQEAHRQAQEQAYREAHRQAQEQAYREAHHQAQERAHQEAQRHAQERAHQEAQRHAQERAHQEAHHQAQGRAHQDSLRQALERAHLRQAQERARQAYVQARQEGEHRAQLEAHEAPKMQRRSQEHREAERNEYGALKAQTRRARSDDEHRRLQLGLDTPVPDLDDEHMKLHQLALDTPIPDSDDEF